MSGSHRLEQYPVSGPYRHNNSFNFLTKQILGSLDAGSCGLGSQGWVQRGNTHTGNSLADTFFGNIPRDGTGHKNPFQAIQVIDL